MDRTQLFRHGLFGGAVALVFGGIAIAAAIAPEEETDRRASVELRGRTVSQSREVADFDRLTLRGSYELELMAGKAYALSLTGDAGVLEKLETRVTERTLVIGLPGERRWRDLDGIEARLSLPTLRGLTIDGAADADLKALDSDELEITINGAGSIAAEGRCGTLSLITNGAGDFEGETLRCRSVAITINGAGDAVVYAAESLRSAINGVGDVTVYGNPTQISKSRSGFGSVTIKSGARSNGARSEPPAPPERR